MSDWIARYTDRGYDRAGRLTRLTGYPVDATNAQNTDYAYNKANVQTRVTYPDDSPGTSRGYVVYSYDAALRLTRINHQDDTNTDVVYDSMGRRLTLTKGEEIDSFAYAATGQVSLAKRGLWIAVLRSYDGLGRLTRETQQNGRDRNVDYAYDKGGNVLTLTYPFSGAVQTSYDALGRALTVKRNGSVLATYNYTGYRPKSQTFETGANDVTLNMTYDGMARMTRMQYAQTGNTSLPDFSYGFDSASDITRKTFNHRSGAPNEDYTYDTLHRLTHTVFGQRTSTPYKGYIYDDQGNHLTQDDNGTTTVGLFNAVNEQTKRGANDVLYDSRGNLTKDDSGKGYFYDRQNMLTCVEDAQGNLVMRYAYDAFNRLIERDCNWAYAMQYNYDGWRRLEECPSDDPGAHRAFIWTPGTAGYIDDLICHVVDPGQYNATYFACRNHNFSGVALLTSGGAVFERYDYNPYGERIVLDPDYTSRGYSAISNPIGFQGLVHDAEAGLIYVRNRYLNTALGRWMQRDPLRYINGLNMYQHTLGNPILWSDPLGLDAVKQTIRLNIGFDSSASADKDTMNIMREAIKDFQSMLSTCCTKFQIGCNINVDRKFDWNRKDKPAPKDGDYDLDSPDDSKLLFDNLKAIGSDNKGIPVLLSGSTIHYTFRGKVHPLAGATHRPEGMILRPGHGDNTLPHEMGHLGGYDAGDEDNGIHSSNSNNLMHTPAEPNAEPDECWCKKVSSLAN